MFTKSSDTQELVGNQKLEARIMSIPTVHFRRRCFGPPYRAQRLCHSSARACTLRHQWLEVRGEQNIRALAEIRRATKQLGRFWEYDLIIPRYLDVFLSPTLDKVYSNSF